MSPLNASSKPSDPVAVSDGAAGAPRSYHRPETRTDQSTQSRRERGVLAQRAYRKRHANKFQDLKEENDRLRDAIRQVSAVATAGGIFTGELDEALRRARDTAGIEDAAIGAGSAASQSGSLQSTKAPQAIIVPASADMTAVGTGGAASVMIVDRNGLVFHNLRLRANVNSYLDATPSTLAGYIYRTVVYYAVQRWQDYFYPMADDSIVSPPLGTYPFPSGPSTASLSPGPSDLPSAFRNPSTKNPFFIRRNEAAIGDVCVFSRPPSHDADESSPTCAHVRTGRCRMSEPKDWWRASDGLETYLRQQLPAEGFARLMRTLEGGGTEEEKCLVDDILKGFARNYKCFGDGPRWNAVYVKLAMDIFESDIMALEAQPE